jgi:DNA-binding MarR family transcriptional regulator
VNYPMDNEGRVKYHPDLHPNHKQPYKLSELVYLCKFYRRGNRREISLALGRTESTVADKVCKLRKAGLLDYYKNLDIGGDAS